MYVLVRESPRAAGTELRFASKPCAGDKAAMDQWRDAYNASRTPAQLKREGRVVSVALTEQLAHEYRRFRSDQPNWLPLQPPAAVREVAMVEADEPEAAAGDGGGVGGGSGGGGGGGGGGSTVEVGLPQTHEGGYPMHPTLHGRRLAFISEGDIWLGELPSPQSPRSPPSEIPQPSGEAAGAAAGAPPPQPQVCCARLTVDGGCTTPCFSPDGARLAFCKAVGGGAEVYVLASNPTPSSLYLTLGGRSTANPHPHPHPNWRTPSLQRASPNTSP